MSILLTVSQASAALGLTERQALETLLDTLKWLLGLVGAAFLSLCGVAWRWLKGQFRALDKASAARDTATRERVHEVLRNVELSMADVKDDVSKQGVIVDALRLSFVRKFPDADVG